MKWPTLPTTLALCAWLGLALPAWADELPEYRVKAAFLYNFALYTEWPAEVGGTLHLCVVGTDPFGREIDALQGKPVGARALAVQRMSVHETLAGCQIVFIAQSASGVLPRILQSTRAEHVLTVAESAGSLREGVALNLVVDRNRVSFEANLPAARAAGINLSSKLLRLAREVVQ